MVHRSHNSSSRSRSPPSASISSSSHTSSSLAPSMINDESDASSRSTRTTPNRHPVELPRTQVASKGGCWTCRLRRKKCDEQREGDSCKTCIRLTIDCLGWGPKRPDWMRDKQQVEAYKAEIKARLTRAGLIRGQPRPPPSTTVAPPAPSQPRSQQQSYTGALVTEKTKRTSSLGLEPEFTFPFVDGAQGSVVLSGMPGLPNQIGQMPASYSDAAVNALDISYSGWFSYPHSPQPIAPSSLAPQLTGDTVYEFPSLDPIDPSVTIQPPSPEPFPHNPITENDIQSGHVLYYFEHVRKVHYVFAGNTFTNVTYALIVQEPRGAVSNAVCALASLHFTSTRVAQGLEAQGSRSEYSNAAYFYNEAIAQLVSAKQLQGGYSESDAFAALHLVSYSQLSGCKENWQRAYDFACEWLEQSRLLIEENPRPLYERLSTTSQLIVRIILWLDGFSSVLLSRPPQYLRLLRTLMGEHPSGYWSPTASLRMDLLAGCPDEAMLCVAESTALSQWKFTERRKGTLSYRELIRRGDDIEQRMRQHRREPFDERDSAPHPNLPVSGGTEASSGYISDKMRKLVANIFRETALLCLYTVLSDCNPGVAEIAASVDTLVQLLQQLTPSDADRGLTFPLCLAGCMTDDPMIRSFIKQRIGLYEEGVGNLLQCRRMIEGIWQKRDREGGPINLRELVKEYSLNLLFV